MLRFSPDSPVTIGIISEELGVSDRSVQRELPTVEKWMKHNGFCFVRKRSVGLLIDETPERLKELAALLDEKDTNSSAPADNRPERLTLLCHYLLLAEEPIVTGLSGEKRSRMRIILSARGVSCMIFSSFPILPFIIQYFTDKYFL